jgi:hypothetical protein
MLQNWKKLGYSSPEDPRLMQAVGHVLSGITTALPTTDAEKQKIEYAASVELHKGQAKDAADAYMKGQRLLPQLQEIRRLAAETPDGIFAQHAPMAANVLASFGYPVPKEWTNTQVMNALTQQTVPLVREPGATAASELTMYLSASPGLKQTREGRATLADFDMAIVSRNRKIYEAYSQNMGNHEKLGAALEAIDKAPLLTPEQRARFEVEYAKLGNRAPNAFDARPAQPYNPSMSPGSAPVPGVSQPTQPSSDGWTTLPSGRRVKEIR